MTQAGEMGSPAEPLLTGNRRQQGPMSSSECVPPEIAESAVVVDTEAQGEVPPQSILKVEREGEEDGGFPDRERMTARRVLQCVALGQLLSLLVTVTAVSSSMLASQGISIPASQSFLNYLLLAIFYGTPMLVTAWQRGQLSLPLQGQAGSISRSVLPGDVPWGGSLWLYLLTSFLDVEGNYLVVLSFRYTSLTSVALLDCWAIPCAMLLTQRFLGVRYALGHAVGVLLCTGGLACLLFSDAHAADRMQTGPAPLLGDALVILGSSLYAGSNVLVEYFATTKKQLQAGPTDRSGSGHDGLLNTSAPDSPEGGASQPTGDTDTSTILGMLGCFGCLISFIQLILFERQELSSLTLSPSALAPFLAFSLALFGFYSLVPVMLRMGGAAFFNLSLLTSDAWAVGISALWFHKFVGPLYFVALLSVTSGLSLYSVQWRVPSGPSMRSKGATEPSE